MPLWLLIALLAHLSNAVIFIVDKVLLGVARPRPVAYAFYINLLGLFALLFIPFGGFVLPDAREVWLSLGVGVTFVAALIAFFHVLREGEASRVVPVVGGFVPLFTLLLAGVGPGQVLDAMELTAFGFLVLGGIVMTIRSAEEVPLCVECTALRRGTMRFAGILGLGGREVTEHDGDHDGHHVDEEPIVAQSHLVRRIRGGVTLHLLEMSAVAGFLFAASFVLSDVLFESAPFVSAFVWTKVGAFCAALALLLIPSLRQAVRSAPRQTRRSHTAVFLGNRVLAGLAFVGLNYAIALGPVTIVNAFQGIQFAFLFVLAVLLSWKFPHLLEEERRGRALFQKIAGIGIIAAGLFFLR